MTELQQDFDNLNEDRVKLLDEIDDMKKRLQVAQQEKEAAQRKYHKEVNYWKNQWTATVGEFNAKF